MARIDPPGLGLDGGRPYLELLNVAKHFGGVQALDDVSLTITRGSVHALVGENGAGKSTLGRIISGAVQPDAGTMLLDGVPVGFHSPREALEHGVAAIAQEPSVVPRLSVAQNVFLGREPRSRPGVVRGGKLDDAYEKLASGAGFHLDGQMPAGRLRTAEQQKVEILRALSRDAQILVMDEPTAALSAGETEQLHAIVRDLARKGTTIILVSHFLREILDLADTVTVLRDGRIVRTSSASDETEPSLVEAMLGRSLTSTFPTKQPAAEARLLLSVQEVHAPRVEDVSFDLHAGEILGIAGLVGAGRTELARAIFGAARIASGTVTLSTGERLGNNPRHSLATGLAMIPESRKDDGLVFNLSAIENTTLSRLGALSSLGIVRRARERGTATSVLDRCDVRGAEYSAPVRALSGGNQQKVLLARTLLCDPTVIIADEPTRGVDVGAKRAIYDFLTELAAEGLGVILISSELDELLGLSHRVIVMRRGRLVRELRGDAITEGAVLAAAFADGRRESVPA